MDSLCSYIIRHVLRLEQNIVHGQDMYTTLFLYFLQIIDIHRATEGGFNRGYLIIQGLGKFMGSKVQVLFQNENLVAHYEDDSSDGMGKIIVTTPDLISGMQYSYGLLFYAKQ